MGIYIRDMTFEEFSTYGEDCQSLISQGFVEEIPPLNRLIDANALKASLAFAEKTAKWAIPALRAVLMVIDEMPTIIPAEQAKEEI